MTIAETIPLYEKLLNFYSPKEAVEWLHSPHPQLDGRKAADCEPAEVAAIIDRLESGAYL